MRESITKKQFIIAYILNGLNTFFYFFGSPFAFNFHSFIFLITMITLDFNCIYLFLSFIYDLSLYVFKSDKLEKMNDILRNKVNVLNPISFLFWFLVISGGITNAFITAYNTIHSIYCHFIISIFLIIDITTNPKYIEIDNIYFSTLIIINYNREHSYLILKDIIDTNLNINILFFMKN